MAYRIDPGASRIMVQVQREGVFSVLAHDHVLVIRELRGEIILDREHPEVSELSLRIPVGAIEVDPPEMRRELDLDGELNEADRSEIRANMLAAPQLGAEAYPNITAVLQNVTGSWPNLTLSVQVRIRDSTRTLRIPVTVSLAGERLQATGAFSLRQRDFGIEPYNTLLGAIAVGDEVQIRFNIAAAPGS